MKGETPVRERPVAARYRWRVRAPDPPRDRDALLRLLLGLRGVAAHEAEHFLAPPYEASLHDPLLLPHCGAVVSRLQQAIGAQEPIVIFGDYDVDGVTASALLAEVVGRLGGVVSIALPHRDEGYGVSVPAVRRLIPPARLLVTVDNGISAGTAVAEAIARGASVIIVDHHAVNGALPPGALVVHPGLPSSRYPNPDLAAVGVAWKVAAALLQQEGRVEEAKYLLDLVCLGTLADSMKLLGENRALVVWGLEVLRHTRRSGLLALAEQAGVDLRAVTAHDVTFRLVPRLNAAGRLRHADLALDLLRAADDGTARRHAVELDAVNTERKVLTEDILGQVKAMLGDALTPVLFVAGPWPPGLLGIIASRLSEEYGRPTVAVASRDGECIASIRGPSTGYGQGAGVDVMALLREAASLLTRFGGHAGAAGFSFPRAALPRVAAFFRDHAPLTGASGAPELLLDCPLPLSFISADVAQALQRLEPFGPGNERPTFLIPDAVIHESRAIGSKGDHQRFVFGDGRGMSTNTGVAFRWGDRPRPGLGARVDVAAELRYDVFRGTPRADLHVQDLRTAE